MVDFDDACYILTPGGRISDEETEHLNRIFRDLSRTPTNLEMAYAYLKIAELCVDVESKNGLIRMAMNELRPTALEFAQRKVLDHKGEEPYEE